MPLLLLVRHGETIANRERRIQGQWDVPLSQRGQLQAQALAERLAPLAIRRCFASDLVRAVETAEILARPHRLPVQQDPRLREIHYGVLQGRTFAEAQALLGMERWPDVTRVPATVRAHPPGGESEQQVLQRLRAFLADLRAELAPLSPEDAVFIVAHGGSLRYLLCLLLDLPARAADAFPFDNCAVSWVAWQGDQARLLAHNDHCHLFR